MKKITAYEYAALAAILGALQGLWLATPGSTEAQTLRLLVGTVVVGFFTVERTTERGLGVALPALAAGLMVAATLAFLAFAYDNGLKASTVSLPLLSGQLLSFKESARLPLFLGIGGVATFLGVSLSGIGRRPLASMVSTIAQVEPAIVERWFTGAAAAVAAIYLFYERVASG
ncbi:MAG: hypothetical protein KDA57_23110 [Planctomycetales bacterium]|nr:hypothetical protein [Planctomycetales bacterium]